ncbi:DEAD/DEAH box helicase [Amycolatopsis minnesotensis]|uniref:AAA domain-containing protein n=1 Tax=Amycolatopsis minnesotensis TaxID=337894 RepID=A0ABP5E163_9PSEU
MHSVTLSGPIALVPARSLDARLREQDEGFPGVLPNGVTQVVADFNARPRGVAATIAAPSNGGDRSLLLYTSAYVVRLYASGRGDAYTVASIKPLRLTDHDRLAKGCLLVRAHWHAMFELRQVPQNADLPVYPYRAVEPVGERRFSASAIYGFAIVGERLPERNRYVRICGDPGQRGQVVRVEEERAVVRFDQPVDWAQLPRQGQLAETSSSIVFAKQRAAVEALRTRQARHESLLSVLVEHRVQPLPLRSEVPGDELDEDQLAAFRKALGVRDMLLVLGPPGTGKTRTISGIARSLALARDHGPVLVSSHTNRAVDNVLAKLPREVVVVRVGNEGKIDPDGRPFLLEVLAADLRREIVGSTTSALGGYAGLPLARQWVPELGRRIGALASAFDVTARAWAELDRIRGLVVGPARERVAQSRSELARQEEQWVRQGRKLARLVRRDERARARRWWSPFDAVARAAARARARRLAVRQAESAGLAEAVRGCRTKVADAERALEAETRDIPEVRAAEQVLDDARRQIEGTRTGVAQAVQAISAALTPVDVLPGIAWEGDPAAVLAALWRLHALLEPRLGLLEARSALLGEWRDEVSGAVEQLYPELVRYADVVGATCVGAATRTEISAVEFDLAIVDEAGQIGVPDLLVPLVRAKRSVLVGDHRQLPPVVKREVTDWARETGDTAIGTMLEKSALEILVGELPDSHIVRLTQQRRMPKVVADFISGTFYDGTLKTMVDRTHDPSLFASPLAFVDTSRLPEHERAESPAGERARGGWVNHAEAALLVLLASYYHRRGAEWALIVPYAAQARLVSEQLRASIRDSDAIDANVGTVDSFQGGERDVILYGFTRSNRAGNVGFLDELRRANVAFTRVKRQLVLVGDMDMLLRAGDLRFRELALSLRDHVRESGDVRRYAEVAARLKGMTA